MEGAGLAAPHETHSGWRARSGAGKAQAWCPECTGGLSSGIKRPRTCPGRAWAYLGYSPWADTRQGGLSRLWPAASCHSRWWKQVDYEAWAPLPADIRQVRWLGGPGG